MTSQRSLRKCDAVTPSRCFIVTCFQLIHANLLIQSQIEELSSKLNEKRDDKTIEEGEYGDTQKEAEQTMQSGGDVSGEDGDAGSSVEVEMDDLTALKRESDLFLKQQSLNDLEDELLDRIESMTVRQEAVNKFEQEVVHSCWRH